ncbi:hypothetical protein DXG01_007141 [Tephrocybe rancida]|nr:hypothetical protein DXG01_007141 [Tephrocybe rancida]
MEEPSIYDDEVIPDSDEEGNGLMPPIPRQNVQAMFQEKIPSITTQDTIETAPNPNGVRQSPISSVGNTGAGSSSVTKPRPKPRPLKKKTEASSSHAPAQEDPSFFSSIQVNAEFSMPNIAERAKMRSRAARSQTQQPIGPTSDIIELSSDDDDDFEITPALKRRKATDKNKAKSTNKSKSISESVDTSDPKPRIRPRPKKKLPPGRSSDPTSPTGFVTQDNLAPTSSISNGTYPIPFKLIPSQLPPSDPPSSTATSHDHPPIETLGAPSSQSSIFSSGKAKRKRAMSNIDELDSDPDPLPGGTTDVDTRLMPPPPPPDPPPTFFAGSSSPMHEDRPPAAPSTGVKPPAIKKPRKKKSADLEDGGDGAWGASKPAAKSKKRKTPAKKVEVVIEKSKSKGKGKGKEKEVFKSREFIDDEDEDDPLDQVTATAASTKPDSLTSLSSVPDSDMDGPLKAGPSKQRKYLDQEDDELDAIGMQDSPDPKRRTTTKGRKKMVIESDDETDLGEPTGLVSLSKASGKAKSKSKSATAKPTPKPSPDVPIESDTTSSNQPAENGKVPQNRALIKPPAPPNVLQTPKAFGERAESLFPSLSSRYTIAPKTKATPMSDLIRRVNSKPGSPFGSPAARNSGARPGTPGTAYSPYVKASRSALSRIAPLHPNRRTPPPPLPPPPPKKKTKKELEREEQWEEELVESVGGITEWACMSDVERREMRKAKRERETCGWED